MSTPIEVLWRQALKTFTGRGKIGYKFCQKNFEKLHALINNINADDVKVDKNILDHVENNSAPMCVIDVYENQDITIAIFLLKHGVTLPLHDHPGMNGLLKVISGTVKIDSYTMTTCLKNMKAGDEVIAQKYPSIIAQKNHPACVLNPNDHNLHEITCIEGPAAFLDILSPPYKVDVDEHGIADRPCTFFKLLSFEETSTSSDNDDSSVLVKLKVGQQPHNFYSKSLKYLGPPLS
ncbi:hypothetical protein PV327_000730 [Microctonus hyperodae]|uniref:2-aminoethanethiol dioxygenase n=1 Tax=Microctonus hyperodae TaxID=165561 RepID=A0AA39G6S2_MICHY|nr:hypothetical protein PV327_000730 [Microctonus hyperodae]